MKKILVIFTFLIIMSSCFSKTENKTYGIEKQASVGGGGGDPILETGKR